MGKLIKTVRVSGQFRFNGRTNRTSGLPEKSVCVRIFRTSCSCGSTVQDSRRDQERKHGGDTGADLAFSFGSYLGLGGSMETDSNAGVASTVSRVNAAEFGVKTTA